MTSQTGQQIITIHILHNILLLLLLYFSVINRALIQKFYAYYFVRAMHVSNLTILKEENKSSLQGETIIK